MVIGYIIGLAFLPISLLLFANVFGFSEMTALFGFPLTLLGAVGVILVMAGDVIDAHMKSSQALRTIIVCILLTLPSILLFLSYVITLPAAIVAALPIIIASFLFVEGVASFLIGAE